jgi:hypothetical protein
MAKDSGIARPPRHFHFRCYILVALAFRHLSTKFDSISFRGASGGRIVGIAGGRLYLLLASGFPECSSQSSIWSGAGSPDLSLG